MKEIFERLEYEPLTGHFSWKPGIGRRYKQGGPVSECRKSDGYIRIKVRGRAYYAHRLAWLMSHGQWPSVDIDHVNGIRHDNRISNLREASRSDNAANRRARSASGLKGITEIKYPGGSRWQAMICKDQKIKYLGTYPTPEEAHAVYMEWARRLFGKFARAV